MIKTLTMHNTKAHWGGAHILGPTSMCLGAVLLLCTKSVTITTPFIIYNNKIYKIHKTKLNQEGKMMKLQERAREREKWVFLCFSFFCVLLWVKYILAPQTTNA
jgi:hypothetical protein